jgi:hypothetical protein
VGEGVERRIIVGPGAIRDLPIERNPIAVVSVIPAQQIASGLSGVGRIEGTPGRPAHCIVKKLLVMRGEAGRF